MNDQKQMISPENTIQLSFKELENTRKKAGLQMGIDVFISGFLYVAVALSVLSIFEIDEITLFSLLPGMLLILVMSIFNKYSKIYFILFCIVLVFVIGCTIIFNDFVMNGLMLVINQMGVQTEWMVHPYTITIEANLHERAMGIFSGLFFLVVAYLCSYVLKRRAPLLIWLFIVPLFLIQLLIGAAAAIYYNFALFFVGFLIANYSFITGSRHKRLAGNNKNSVIIFNASIILFVFLTCFILLNVIEPVSSYKKNDTVLQMKQGAIDFAEDFRYEKEQTNTFTQGDFTKLGELKLSDSPALKVVMSKPTSLYLRGYVGSAYTSSAWRSLDYQVYHDSYNLFYWLRNAQFNALNQLSIVNQLTENDSKNEEGDISVTIHNVNANSKYFYTPYELKTSPDHFPDAETFDDSMITSSSFFGNRVYEYQSSDNIVKKYPTVANKLYQVDETDDYFKNESYYNEYVYENYLDIPKDTKLVLQGHVEDLENSLEKRMSYEAIIQNVKSFVSEVLQYNEDAKPLAKSNDFIQFLLEESREGYSTHYATLATLLFRGYGVPARYVEGYLITPKDIENVSEFEEIVLTGKNAHAWTEIYIDRLGWIPIEVTPPYYEQMEGTDLSNYPKKSGGSSDSNEAGNVSGNHSNNHLTNNQNNNSGNNSGNGQNGNLHNPPEKQLVKDDELPPPSSLNKKPEEEISVLERLLYILFILLLCLLLAAIIYVIKRRMDVSKRNKSFQDPNYRVSIPRMFAYTVSLIHYAGLIERGGSMYRYTEDLQQKFGDDYVETYKKVIAINQQCLYSHDEIQPEQYEQMKLFMNETLSKLIQSQNRWQRLKMKFWDFIF